MVTTAGVHESVRAGLCLINVIVSPLSIVQKKQLPFGGIAQALSKFGHANLCLEGLILFHTGVQSSLITDRVVK